MSVIENGRAKFAFDCAKQGASLGQASEYKSYVKKIPMMIKTNGLAPALAFVFSKSGSGTGGEAYKKIYDQIEAWLKQDPKQYLGNMPPTQANPGGGGGNKGGGNVSGANPALVEKIISMDSDTYRATTKEVLDFLSWLKRFAEGMIKKD